MGKQSIEARIRNRVELLQQAEQNTSARHQLLKRASPRPIIRRAWIVSLSAVAVLFLTFLSLTTAAANSLPGDSLYGINQWRQHAVLTWTSDQSARAQLLLTQLQQAQADLNRVVREHRTDIAIQEALATVNVNTQSCQQTINALPAGQSREMLEHSLANALREERQTLHRLLPQVDWANQLAFTHQLGVLGEPIPSIIQVTLVKSTDGMQLLTITGKNFASGVHLIINGSPRSIVLSNTSTTLHAQIPRIAQRG